MCALPQGPLTFEVMALLSWLPMLGPDGRVLLDDASGRLAAVRQVHSKYTYVPRMTHTHRIRKPPPRGGGQNNIIVPTFPCVNFNTAELISLTISN